MKTEQIIESISFIAHLWIIVDILNVILLKYIACNFFFHTAVKVYMNSFVTLDLAHVVLTCKLTLCIGLAGSHVMNISRSHCWSPIFVNPNTFTAGSILLLLCESKKLHI